MHNPEIEKLSSYIDGRIKGVFSPTDIAVMKEELETLKKGDIYIELSIKEKRLKLPFVFDAEQIIKKISNMVERYKEKVIEEDIKKDIKR